MEEKAAVYCRLSQDDGSVGESGSIQTQRTLLTQYCKEQHISIADYYCDDGWSGTNFERPEFQRMLEDIESGKVKIDEKAVHLPDLVHDVRSIIQLRQRIRADGYVH